MALLSWQLTCLLRLPSVPPTQASCALQVWPPQPAAFTHTCGSLQMLGLLQVLAAINTCANIKPRYGMASELVLHGEAPSPTDTTLPVPPGLCAPAVSFGRGSHHPQV